MKQNIAVEKCPDCSVGNQEYCARPHPEYEVKGMKQNITTSQLNELSDKGKGKLLKWSYQKKYYRKNARDAMSAEATTLSDRLPLLSIGQMIEFLGEHKYKDGDSFYGWKLDLKTSEYICDALWEACKEVLK